MKTGISWIVALSLAGCLDSFSQAPAEVAGVPEAVRPYYEQLILQPEPGALIDRLCKEWSSDGKTPLKAMAASLAEAAKDPEKNAAFGRAAVAAFVYEKAGDPEEASRWFGAALRRNPRKRNALLWKARVDSAREAREMALNLLDQLLSGKDSAGKPVFLPVWLEREALQLRGEILIRSDQESEGIETFRKALALSPNDLEFQAELTSFLLSEGREDVAASWVVEQLEPLADAYLEETARSGVRISLGALPEGEARLAAAVFQLIGGKEELRKAVLSHLAVSPQVDGNRADRARAGVLCELLGAGSAAVGHYEAYLAENPGDDVFRLRKLAVLPRGLDSLDTLLAEIEKLDPKNLPLVKGLFVDATGKAGQTAAGRTALLTAVLERTETDFWIRDALAKELSLDIGWATALLMTPYRFRGLEKPLPDSEHAAACERFLRVLLKLPEHRLEGLVLLVAKYEAEERPIPEELWTFCLEILERGDKLPARDGSEEELRGPVAANQRSFPEIAAALAWQHGRESELRGAIEHRRERFGKVGDSGELEIFADLYFSEEKVYPAALQSRLMDQEGEMIPAGREWVSLLRTGTRIAADRGLGIGLNEVFEACYKKEALVLRDTRLITDYARSLSERGRTDEASTLVESIFGILIEAAGNAGKGEKAVEFLAEAQAERTRRLAFEFLVSISSEKSLPALTAWKLWDATDAKKPDGLFLPLPLFLKDGSIFTDGESYFRSMELFGLTEPAPQFFLKPVPDAWREQLGVHEWMSLFIGHLRRSQQLIPEIEEIATARFPDSPGPLLLLSFGRHGLDGQGWRKPIEARLDLLEALPEAEKPVMASYLQARTYAFRDCPKLGDWLWKHWNAELKAQVDALLAKEPENADYVKFDRYLAGAVKHRQYDYGLEILKRWVERQRSIAPPSQRGRLVPFRLMKLDNAQSYYTPDRSWRWWLDPIEAFEFQFRAFHDPELAPFEFKIPLNPLVSQLNLKTRRWEPRDVESRISKLQFVGRWKEDHPSRMLLIPSAYGSLISRTEVRDRKLPVELAKKVEGPGSWLLHESAALGENADQPRSIRIEGLPARLAKYYRDTELPLPVRLHLVNWNFDDARFPFLMEREVMLEFLDLWEEALYPEGPDSAIPMEMADVANRMAIALRGLKRRDNWHLDRDRLAAATERLLAAVKTQIKQEKREVAVGVGKPEGGSSIVLSAFWPAFFNLLLAEGNLEEAFGLWEWMVTNEIEFRWSRSKTGDGLNDEAGFLKLLSMAAFKDGGWEATAALFGRIDAVQKRTGDPKRNSEKIDQIVLAMMLGLEPADRVRLVAGWLSNPPDGVDLLTKWDLIKPLSRPSTLLGGKIRARTSQEELFREFVRELQADPIDERTEPLVLARIFHVLMSYRSAPAWSVAAWLESEFEPGEIESSPVLREVNWALGGPLSKLEARHLDGLENANLPSRFRFQSARQFWLALNYRDPKSWPDPSDETFGRLTRAVCRAAVEEIQGGRSFDELHDSLVPSMLKALAIRAKADPEASAIAERVVANASGFLKGVNASASVSSGWWIDAFLGLISVENDPEAALPIIEAAAAQPNLAAKALDRYLIAGFYEEAGRHFERSWKQIDSKRPRLTRFEPAFLAMADSIEDEEVRFLGELHVSWMLDPPAGKESKEFWGTARKRRIEKLAGQFREINFSNQSVREKAFDTLVSVAAGREFLKEEIRQAMGGDLQSVIATQSDEGFSKQWQMWKLNLNSMAEDARLAEFEAVVPSREWFASKPIGGTGKASRQQQVWLGVFEALGTAHRSATEDEWERLKRIFVELESIPVNQGGSRFGQPRPSEASGFVTLASVRRYAGERLAFDVVRGVEQPGAGWFDTLPDDVSDPGNGRFNMHLIALSYLRTAKALSPAGEGTLEERREAVAKFLEASLPIQLFGPEHQRFFLLDYCGWLSRDEILEIGIDEAEANPRGGHAFADLAAKLQSQYPDRAHPLMKRALEMLDPGDKTWPVRGYHSTWKRLEAWKASQSETQEASQDSEKK